MAKKNPVIALIGVSGYARQLLRCLHQALESTGIELAAAVVINQQEEEATCRQLQERGCTIFSDYRQMLRELGGGIDLCLIPTSIHLHSSMSIDALAVGANVLVEKPLAGSVREAQRIIDAGRKYGKMVAVGFQDLYAFQTWEIKEVLTSEKYGAVQSIRITGSWPRDKAYYTRNNWAGRTHHAGLPVFDSPLNNAFAHFLNLGLFFASPALLQSAEVNQVAGRLLRFYPIETFDTCHVQLTTPENVIIDCRLTHADPEVCPPQIVIRTETSKLIWTCDQSAVLASLSGEIIKEWALGADDATRVGMLQQVIDAVTWEKEPLCPATIAMRHVEAIERIHQSLPLLDGTRQWGLSPRAQADLWNPVPNLFARLLAEKDAVVG